MTGVEEAKQVQQTYRREARIRGAYDLGVQITLLGQSDRFRRRMVSRLDLSPGDRVLDIGCGTGLNFNALVDAVGPTGEVVGIDLTSEMLAQADHRIKQNQWTNVRTQQADATALPFEAGEFSAVCATLAFSVIPDTRKALEQAQRVLRPGGRIALLDCPPLGGKIRWLRPILRSLGKYFVAWQPEADIVQVLTEVFGKCKVSRMVRGLFFIASARK